MRTALIPDEELLRITSEITGLQEPADIVRAGLQALIAVESRKRLARLGGY